VKAVPVAPAAVERLPLIDLRSGYVLRSLAEMPSQGPEAPWRLYQNYPRDLRLLRRSPISDGTLQFSRAHHRIDHAIPGRPVARR
jgi:monooxygenase